MNMKRNLLFLILIVLFSTIAFAQVRTLSQKIYYDNEKINIIEYFRESNDFILPLNKYGISKHRSFVITNKTNNDMEVTINYTIDLYGLDRKKEWLSREKKITRQTITLRPHDNYELSALSEIMKSHKDLESAFPGLGFNTRSIVNFELVHFKIIERNYEIR